MIVLHPGYHWIQQPEFSMPEGAADVALSATIMLPDGSLRHFIAPCASFPDIAAGGRRLTSWLHHWRAIPDDRHLFVRSDVLGLDAAGRTVVRLTVGSAPTDHNPVFRAGHSPEFPPDARIHTAPSPTHWLEYQAPPPVDRRWCPLCAPERDITREILDVRYCTAHVPNLAGLDDERVTVER